MGLETNIHFTLDTICPWTYIAKKRLDAARERVKATHPDVDFKLQIHPYRLFDDAPEQGEDKYEWYKRTKYNDSEEQMHKYTTVMGALGEGAGIHFRFGGTIASTLNAHRVIQVVQERHGAGVAEPLVNSLYYQYFEQEQHPSAPGTLMTALRAAGVAEPEAEALVQDESEGLMEVKMLIREQAGNGVDAVPYIVLEGRRRDLTLEGAREVDEYVKSLEQIIKESK